MATKKYDHRSLSTNGKVLSIMINDGSSEEPLQLNIEYDPSDRQHIRINSRKVAIANTRIDIDPTDLPEESKPGCFGAYGLPSCKIPGCVWFPRCKQSREDF